LAQILTHSKIGLKRLYNYTLQMLVRALWNQSACTLQLRLRHLWKQSTYRLLLRAQLNARYLHIAVVIRGPLKM